MAKRDRPLAFGRPDPAQDRLQPDAVLVGRPDFDRLVRGLGPLLGDGLFPLFLTPRAPPAWPRRDGAGGASAPTSRSPSGPPSPVEVRPRRARVRPPSRPPLCGWTTGPHRAAVGSSAYATAPEARGAARAARLHCAGAGR